MKLHQYLSIALILSSSTLTTHAMSYFWRTSPTETPTSELIEKTPALQDNLKASIQEFNPDNQKKFLTPLTPEIIAHYENRKKLFARLASPTLPNDLKTCIHEFNEDDQERFLIAPEPTPVDRAFMAIAALKGMTPFCSPQTRKNQNLDRTELIEEATTNLESVVTHWLKAKKTKTQTLRLGLLLQLARQNNVPIAPSTLTAITWTLEHEDHVKTTIKALLPPQAR